MAIRKEFQLSLFGFDAIFPIVSSVDNANNLNTDLHNQSIDQNSTMKKNLLQFLVIDINYFPSYKEVPDFPVKFRQFLRKKASERERTQYDQFF
jgi:hypothetical protein